METMTPAQMPVSVLITAGGRLLDEAWPRWWQTVDPDTVDQSQPDRCVLGQLAGGNWVRGLDRLFPELTVSGQMLAAGHAGFWVDDRGKASDQPLSEYTLARYVVLTQAWRAEIKRRRAGLN